MPTPVGEGQQPVALGMARGMSAVPRRGSAETKGRAGAAVESRELKVESGSAITPSPRCEACSIFSGRERGQLSPPATAAVARAPGSLASVALSSGRVGDEVLARRVLVQRLCIAFGLLQGLEA